MQVATYFPILSTEKAFQVHIPIFFAVTADEQIVSKQAIWSLMKSHGNDVFNLQMKNNISDFSFSPVNVLKKKSVINSLKTWRIENWQKNIVLFGL